MSRLDNEQKQLIFDYCIGLTSDKQKAQVEALISSNQEAAEIHSKLKAALKPLGSLEFDHCPDELVERTIWRVNELADTGQQQLKQLLAAEQTKKVTIKIGFWRNLSEMAAVAAAVMLIIGVLVPTFGVARHKYRRQQCQTQLGSIFKGLNNYISDHNGRLPAVATTIGAPWWKVGDQGSENHSNTRHIYLLVKGNYVNLMDFVCPGSRGDRNCKIVTSQICTYKDFPNRRYVSYSFQIRCRKAESGRLHCRKVLMADWNPLFENLPEDFSKTFKLRLDRRLLTLNSINHDRRGQSVLFGDGRVEFLKRRHISIAEDDIFTLQDTDIYQGYEVPSRETDFFLAP